MKKSLLKRLDVGSEGGDTMLQGRNGPRSAQQSAGLSVLGWPLLTLRDRSSPAIP